MNLTDFKQHAKLIEDNREQASKNWMKTWGFDFWFNLWGYRTYELGRFKYKSGRVTLRHGGYQKTECYIDGELVTEYKFKKELAHEPTPPYIPSEPIPHTAQRTKKRLKTQPTNQLQLKL